MNVVLNPRNGTSLTNIVDGTAHSISLFQENEQPKTINDIFVPNTDIIIAEPIEVQIDELGNNTIQMYQFISIPNDEHICGLEPLLKYMNEHFSVKTTQPYTNISIPLQTKQYNEETHNMYNIDKTTAYNITHRCTISQYNKLYILILHIT